MQREGRRRSIQQGSEQGIAIFCFLFFGSGCALAMTKIRLRAWTGSETGGLGRASSSAVGEWHAVDVFISRPATLRARSKAPGLFWVVLIHGGRLESSRRLEEDRFFVVRKKSSKSWPFRIGAD